LNVVQDFSRDVPWLLIIRGHLIRRRITTAFHATS